MPRTRCRFGPRPARSSTTIRPAAWACGSIPPFYDSLVGKLIVHGKTRSECLMRLKRALDEFVIDGIETTLPLFRALAREKDIIDGDYHIHWLEEFLARGGLEQ
jgi:acetyl-CoA carboxylase biotin carboxylase subunit